MQYGVGAALHLPIFDAGKLRANLAGATADLDAAIADYNQSVVTSVREAADAITSLQAAQGRLAEQSTAMSAAQASFALARDRYTSGLIPQLNVLSAEDLVIRAQRQSATLNADLLSARVTLVMALGGGFTPPPPSSVPSPSPQSTSSAPGAKP